MFPTLFIHYHISYYYSYITTHCPLSHHPPHHLLSHHLLYNPHTPTLYSQPLKKTTADCRNVWFNNISWLVNCTKSKPYVTILCHSTRHPIADFILQSVQGHSDDCYPFPSRMIALLFLLVNSSRPLVWFACT